MYIGIPIDSKDIKKAKIAKTFEAVAWAIVEFDEGVIKNIALAPSWQESGVEWLDFVVLENRFENAFDFLNEGIVVLARRQGQDSIEDIIEGFKFKELDEIGF
jgi:predicted Fe-Mo cluster-binding NifX family protein